jgi:diguanylate cyclase (GGDEF)-like protein/PAS domain S-box-containing protein
LTLLRLINGDFASAPAPGGAPLDDAAFRDLFEHAGALLAILDAEGRFVAVSDACERVLGHPPDVLVGRNLFDFVSTEDAKAIVGAKRDGGSFFELLARHRHADGSFRWLRWSGGTHGERWFAAAGDVTDQIRLEDRVGRDPLTRLPNREVFAEELAAALERSAGSGQRVGVLFVDVDGLKQINDGVGHDAGDRLLAQVAERLRAVVRSGDVVARLGGDEFGVFVESLADEGEAAALARRILAALEAPLELGNGPIATSASVGVTLATSESATALGLVHEADVAMYRAKAEGRNRFVMFDADMRADMQLRRDVERDLHMALAHNELVLHYQPIVSLDDGRVVGAEALLRWCHPRRGLLAADEFIWLAEHNGLILPIGRWALQTAARQASSWALLDSPEVTVSVNVSPRQLVDEDLVASVQAALSAHRLPAERLCVEIGEGVALADTAKAIDRLRALRDLGVKIALDDFGSGYSPLRALLQLPIDTIKLDEGFVAEFTSGQSRTTRAILLATVTAARELGLRVIACGVVSRDQLEALRDAGCDCAQGDGIAPPAAGEQSPAERRVA